MGHHLPEPARLISVDEVTCRKDGLCAQVCPARAFSHREGQPPEIGNETLCCLCGQCLAACPSGAISHSVPQRESRARWVSG